MSEEVRRPEISGRSGVRGMLRIIEILLETRGSASLEEIEKSYRSSYARQLCSTMRKLGMLERIRKRDGTYYKLTRRGVAIYPRLRFKDDDGRREFLRYFERRIGYMFISLDMLRLRRTIGTEGMNILFDTLFRALSTVDEIFTEDLVPNNYMNIGKDELIMRMLPNILSRVYDDERNREHVFQMWTELLTEVRNNENPDSPRLFETLGSLRKLLLHLSYYINPRDKLVWFIIEVMPYLGLSIVVINIFVNVAQVLLATL
jgi:hypothetical protein